MVSAALHSYETIAPLLARLVVNNALSSPLFTVALQRDTVSVGGNVGSLTIGELPHGIKNDSLTWVPVRLYTKAQGGLPPPPESPNEVRYFPSALLTLIDGGLYSNTQSHGKSSSMPFIWMATNSLDRHYRLHR
jgi:hypothetical protein